MPTNAESASDAPPERGGQRWPTQPSLRRRGRAEAAGLQTRLAELKRKLGPRHATHSFICHSFISLSSVRKLAARPAPRRPLEFRRAEAAGEGPGSPPRPAKGAPPPQKGRLAQPLPKKLAFLRPVRPAPRGPSTVKVCLATLRRSFELPARPEAASLLHTPSAKKSRAEVQVDAVAHNTSSSVTQSDLRSLLFGCRSPAKRPEYADLQAVDEILGFK